MVTAGFPEVATIENSMHQDEAPRKDWQPEIVVFCRRRHSIVCRLIVFEAVLTEKIVVEKPR